MKTFHKNLVNKLFSALLIISMSAIVTVKDAHATPLKSNTIYVNTSTTLYEVDLATTTATSVGQANPSISQIEDIAFDGNELYGLTYLMQIFKYNENTSAMVAVNNYTSYALHHRGLEARSGTFYAAGYYGLQTVNKQTGAFTDVGYYGLGAGERVNDLAFSADGTLYAIVSFGLTYDYLGTINPDTGELSLIGNTFVSGTRGLTEKDGELYLINSVGNLYSLSKTSGASTLIANGLVAGAYGMDTSPAAGSYSEGGSGGGSLSLPLMLMIVLMTLARMMNRQRD